MESVPLHKDEALKLVESLVPYVEFQSTLEYLKNPPEGYLHPGVDVLGGLSDIADAVKAGEYSSEYDFQTDIQALFMAAQDTHLSFVGDAAGVFKFKRENTPLLSFSSDGNELPIIMCASDNIALTRTGGVMFRNTTGEYTPSEVVAIDGIDVETFLLAQSHTANLQDPDGAYNYIFAELAQLAQRGVIADGLFANPVFYPGPQTSLTFKNGTTSYVNNAAIVQTDFSGVTTGEDFYQKFCSLAPTVVEESETEIRKSPIIPFYPYPVIKHSKHKLAGYFLNDTGYTDVAVLTLLSFDVADEAAIQEYAYTVQSFLASAKAAGKTKLVIDLRANLGDSLHVGLDVFAQLFPNLAPVSQGNMRAHDSLNVIGQGLSNIAASTGPLGGPFDYQSNAKPDGPAFASWAELYGPKNTYGDSFTNLFQGAYKFNYTGGPAFDAENIVMLSEGYCQGTCAAFAELMKNVAGVRSIAIGGRAQHGPMQAIGGTKGSIPMTMGSLYELSVNVSSTQSQAFLAAANETEFAALSPLPVLRTINPLTAVVNGKNNIRVGDSSTTPLQFVYEAADCRFFNTREMLIDYVPAWERCADIAFHGQYEYCVKDSTNHGSCLTGGSADSTDGLGICPLPVGAKDSNNSTVPAGTGAPGAPDAVVGTKNTGSTGSGSGNATTTGSGYPATFTGAASVVAVQALPIFAALVAAMFML